jgi:Skp family chaperone for outer membrane proteins
MAVTAIKPRNAVESLRDIVQDLLVPELKAIKVEVESHRRESKTEFDSIRNEVKALSESLRTEMRLRDEKQSLATQALSEKLGYALDIRERLAVLEDRADRS